MANIKAVYAWAWAIHDINRDRWLLCRWADPFREVSNRKRPSPEAVRVRVRLEPLLSKRVRAQFRRAADKENNGR